MLVAVAVIFVARASADRLLTFSAEPRFEGPTRVAEVTGAGQVLFRLRSRTTSVIERAQKAVESLQAAALSTLDPPSVAIAAGPQGAWIVSVGGRPVVTADKETAQLSATSPAALATVWQTALKKVFQENYLALGEQSEFQVPVGEARYLQFGGPLGKTLVAASRNESTAAVSVEPTLRRIRIYGAGEGDTTVTITAGTLHLGFPIKVRHWAAKFLTSTVAELTGSGHEAQLARKVAINAALAAAETRPGAILSVSSASREGSVFRVGVLASGPEYFDAKAQVEVQLRWTTPPSKEPVYLLVSNAPERIYGLGCLLREELPPSQAVRVLYHHVNSTNRPLLFVVRIANATPAAASTHVIVAEAGPGRDELAVGHAAAVRFWAQWRTGSGYVLQIPPMSASDIVRVPTEQNAIVSGLAQITSLSPSPLLVEVIAIPVEREAQWVEPLSPQDYVSPRLTAFRFPAKKTVQLKHQIGGPWTFYSLGREGSTNEAGTYLAGDYGVLHEIDLELINPLRTHGFAILEVRAGGGVMRGLFAIDGVLHETRMLTGTQQQRLLKVDVSGGTTRRIRIETIPQSASNYPVQLIVHSQLHDEP